MKASSKILLALTAVAALSFAYPASVQAVPITYTYTGNPFITVHAPYTTSDFVSGMLTLAAPLAANMPLTIVSPIDIIAFSFSDGVQTITQPNATGYQFSFATGSTGAITAWSISIVSTQGLIDTVSTPEAFDLAQFDRAFALNRGAPGTWTSDGAPVSDTGSSLSMMTLTLIALGVAARKFKRAAA